MASVQDENMAIVGELRQICTDFCSSALAMEDVGLC